jgi:type III restriction enzyme
LTVIPNETYETFVTQYQKEINDVYGTKEAGAKMRHNHKGEDKDIRSFKRNQKSEIEIAFKKYWKALAKKTDYSVYFDQPSLISSAIKKISEISIPQYLIEVRGGRINSINESNIDSEHTGRETTALKANFNLYDYLEEFSESTGLDYSASAKILMGLKNHADFVRNPPRFLAEAIGVMKQVELDEMLRGLNYNVVGDYEEDFDSLFPLLVKAPLTENNLFRGVRETPNKGIYDGFLYDSGIEDQFGLYAENDPEVVCFLKLPSWYKIKTPIGEYEPDFGLVMKRKELKSGNENEFYFVIETKGTNNVNDKKALTESEVYKIKCAMKHFTTLGVEVHYNAPIKDYQFFRTEADKTINKVIEQ